jgi:hypothetical protein
LSIPAVDKHEDSTYYRLNLRTEPEAWRFPIFRL